MQLVSGFYGGKEHYSGSSNPAKAPAKNGERNCAPPPFCPSSLSSSYSPVMSLHPTGGKRLRKCGAMAGAGTTLGRGRLTEEVGQTDGGALM
jgi:hypothetical protein